MKASSEPVGNGVTCISISVISCEYEGQKSKGMVSVDNKEIGEGPRNTGDALEYAINSRQHLCAEDVPPKMITQVICSLVVAMAHSGIGALNGFSGVTLPQLTQPESEDIYLTPNNVALFGSIGPLGIAFGALVCGPLVARIGHCKTMMIALPIMLASWLTHTFASSVTLLIVARAAIGLMSGVIYSTSTGYTLEIAHKDRRGILFSATPVIRHSGMFFVYTLGSSPLTWRQMALVCGVVTTIPPFIGLFFFPESPRWLLTRGREEDALKSLIYFRGQKYDSQSELKAIVAQVHQDNKKVDIRSQFSQLLQKDVRYMILMLALVSFISNFNGSFSITTYLVPIFQAVELDVDAYTSAILVGFLRVVGTVFQLVLIDRLGRRPLHLSTYFVMSLTVAIIGGYLYVQDIEWVVSNFSWLPLTSLLIYTFFMGVGQPVLMMMLGELLPTNVRAIGVSILVFISFLGSFVVGQVYYLMTDVMGVHGTFWTYGIISMIVFIVSYFTLPETRGRSLEEINDRKRNGVDSQPKTDS